MNQTEKLLFNKMGRLYVKKMVNGQLINVYFEKQNMKAVNEALKNFVNGPYGSYMGARYNIPALRNYLMVKRGASLPPYNKNNSTVMPLTYTEMKRLARNRNEWVKYRGGAGRGKRPNVNSKGRQIYVGPKGGRYIVVNGIKVYLGKRYRSRINRNYW